MRDPPPGEPTIARETCWTLIRAAAAGEEAARTEFADWYERVLRTYFEARWRTAPQRNNVDDGIQEVFVACFRDGGALAKADPGRGSGFRGFLHGIARNVARGFERKQQRSQLRRVGSELDVGHLPDEQPDLPELFDKAYAKALLRAAASSMRERARQRSPEHERRTELLRLRFEEGLAIKDIAERWQVENKWLHHQYEQAQKEFRACFRDIVRDSERLEGKALDGECEALLAALR